MPTRQPADGVAAALASMSTLLVAMAKAQVAALEETPCEGHDLAALAAQLRDLTDGMVAAREAAEEASEDGDEGGGEEEGDGKGEDDEVEGDAEEHKEGVCAKVRRITPLLAAYICPISTVAKHCTTCRVPCLFSALRIPHAHAEPHPLAAAISTRRCQLHLTLRTWWTQVDKLTEMLERDQTMHEDFGNIIPSGKCGVCIARGEGKPRNGGYGCFSCNVRVCWHPACLRDHLALNRGNRAKPNAPLVRKDRAPASGEAKNHFTPNEEEEETAPAPAPAARGRKRTR